MNTIKAIPITSEEQKKLHKISRARLWFLFLLILPLSSLLFYLLYLALYRFAKGQQDTFSDVYPILFFLFFFVANHYTAPQYSIIRHCRGARTKEIIPIVVNGIFFFNNRPYIKTDWGTLNTKNSAVISWNISTHKATAGDTLYLHLIPCVKSEILRITKSNVTL